MTDSLVIEGILFSVLALGLIVILAWWLYASPMRVTLAQAQVASRRLGLILALLIGLGSLLISVGGYWDASEHIVTGIIPGGEDFLWPPHLMLYAGFLLSFVVAISGLAALALPNIRSGAHDPRQWVRRNPYVGAVVLAAGYGLLSIPGDAIWHELFGIDLTAWSPPHIFLMVAASSTPIFAIGLLLQAYRKGSGANSWQSLFVLFFLALVLSEIFLIAVLEWEIGRVNGYVAQRPVWLYPTLIGTIAFFTLSLARRLVPLPWTATVTALLFFGWRIGVSAFADVVSGAPPRLTLIFILGAVLMDLVAQRMSRQSWQRSLAETGVFTAGYAVVALPTIHFLLLSDLRGFTFFDHAMTIVVTFVVGVLVREIATRLGGWLRREPGHTDSTSPMRMSPADALSAD